ncbi:MAG: hypothetical protein JRI25_24565, partial [Deltaproteobacteria bacterium]|nr:hypothetical protein [Deltaproteobacteria bacterium]
MTVVARMIARAPSARRLVPLFVLGAVMACRAEEEPEPVGTAMDLSEVVRHEA